jgi:hypothetical protein
LEAEGLDEPQAAAIRPAAMTTPAILSELPKWRRPRLGVDAVESVVLGTVVLGTVVRPRSFWSAYGWSGNRPARPRAGVR